MGKLLRRGNKTPEKGTQEPEPPTRDELMASLFGDGLPRVLVTAHEDGSFEFSSWFLQGNKGIVEILMKAQPAVFQLYVMEYTDAKRDVPTEPVRRAAATAATALAGAHGTP